MFHEHFSFLGISRKCCMWSVIGPVTWLKACLPLIIYTCHESWARSWVLQDHELEQEEKQENGHLALLGNDISLHKNSVLLLLRESDTLRASSAQHLALKQHLSLSQQWDWNWTHVRLSNGEQSQSLRHQVCIKERVYSKGS